MASGLGKGTLDFIPMNTATEVIHSESEKMQNRSLHLQYLEGEIITLVKALCELSGKIGNPIDASEITVVWQDSVIIDTENEKKQDRADVMEGLMAGYEYRMKYMGETEDEARSKIEEIKNGSDPFRRNDYGFNE
jgi:A118 family predicted phage portal protein